MTAKASGDEKNSADTAEGRGDLGGQPADSRIVVGIQRVLRWVGHFEIGIVVVSLAGICLLVGISVAYRYFLGTSLVWAPEISLLMFQALVFAGAPAVYKARAYITMDFIFRALPLRAQQTLMLLTWILAGTFAATTCWQALGRYETQITTLTYILELPKFYYTIPLIYGTFSLLLTNIFYAATSALYLLGSFSWFADAPSFEQGTTISAGTQPEQ